MPRLPVRALVLLSIAAAVPLRAQTPQIAPERPLTVEEAMAIAFEKNLNLKIQTNSNESAKESFKVTEANFDPQFTAGLTRSMSQQVLNTSTLEGAIPPRTDTTRITLGASKLIGVTNGTLGVEASVGRTGTNSTTSLLNPNYSNSVSLTYSQPLQTFGRNAAYAQLERAKIGLTINNYNYTNQILTLISNVENAYYNLVTARETLAIRQRSANLSQVSLDESRTRRQAGTVIDLDVSSAELSYARAQNAILQAQQAVRDAEDALLLILNVNDFNVRPGPVQFKEYTEGVPNFAEAYKLARERYPTTNSQEETIKQLQIDLDVARRNLRPNVRLNGGIGYNARNSNESYWDAIGNLPHENGNTWNFGVNYTLPWGRKAEKARYRIAQINLENGNLTLAQLEQELIRQVRVAVTTIETNLSAVQIAANATVFAERQYEQQKARYDSGVATSLLVLQAQDAVETARNSELVAKLTLRRAYSELQRLTGASFQRYNIQPPQ